MSEGLYDRLAGARITREEGLDVVRLLAIIEVYAAREVCGCPQIALHFRHMMARSRRAPVTGRSSGVDAQSSRTAPGGATSASRLRS